MKPWILSVTSFAQQGVDFSLSCVSMYMIYLIVAGSERSLFQGFGLVLFIFIISELKDENINFWRTA
jgi:hypothetical protein